MRWYLERQKAFNDARARHILLREERERLEGLKRDAHVQGANDTVVDRLAELEALIKEAYKARFAAHVAFEGSQVFRQPYAVGGEPSRDDDHYAAQECGTSADLTVKSHSDGIEGLLKRQRMLSDAMTTSVLPHEERERLEGLAKEAHLQEPKDRVMVGGADLEALIKKAYKIRAAAQMDFEEQQALEQSPAIHGVPFEDGADYAAKKRGTSANPTAKGHSERSESTAPHIEIPFKQRAKDDTIVKGRKLYSTISY